MKLRNKRTGEIVDFKIIADYDDCTSGWRLEKHNGTVLFYDHIDEIYSEWEDYNELEYWYIDDNGDILLSDLDDDKLWKDLANQRKEMGNYFDTREQAEQAVEKLKAWKRLKDNGFRFNGWRGTQVGSNISYIRGIYYDGCVDDMDLLFGGEE